MEHAGTHAHRRLGGDLRNRHRRGRRRHVYGLLTKLLGRVPIVGSTAVTRGLRLTAVDSAGRRKKVSTIVVEPAHVEGVDETEQHEDHTNGAEEASHDDKDSKDKHD